MSQDNLFNPSNFQSNPGLYHPDMTMQFAATVPPPRANPASASQRNPMFFHNPSISNQEVLIQHQQFMHVYPNSPYERPESVSGSVSGKQLQTKAERRAEHNAIERARRESLNVKFQQLAFTLPNLQNDTRPSKSTIIDRTLDFVKNAIQKEERYLRRINELEKFNSYLLSESDKRLQHKKSKKSHSSPSPVMPAFDSSSIIEKACSVQSDKDIQDTDQAVQQDEAEEDDHEEDEDEDLEDLVEAPQHYQEPMPMFKVNGGGPMHQMQFNGVTTPPNSSKSNDSSTINSNNSNNLPVSLSSVTMMPNSTNWPSCNNVIQAQPMVKEEQVSYYQLQQQAFMMQKFQDHAITPPQQHVATEQEDFHYGSNPAMFAMMNNPFMNATTQQHQQQQQQQQQQHHHHHFMHRR